MTGVLERVARTCEIQNESRPDDLVLLLRPPLFFGCEL